MRYRHAPEDRSFDMKITGKKRSFFYIVIALSLCLFFAGGCRKQSGTAETAASAAASSSVAAASVETPAAATTTADASPQAGASTASATDGAAAIDEQGSYTTKDEVALYLHTYGHLPDNFITKDDARALGWDASSGNLHKVAPGKSIGGDRFGNREGLLPSKRGRQYYECDIDYKGGSRGAKRIVFSDDGLVFYTEDHYASFEQLY